MPKSYIHKCPILVLRLDIKILWCRVTMAAARLSEDGLMTQPTTCYSGMRTFPIVFLKKYLCVTPFGSTCTTDLNVRKTCKKLLSHQPWLIWFYWGAGNLLVAVSVLPCLLCIFFCHFLLIFHIWNDTSMRLLLKFSAIQSYHHQCSSSVLYYHLFG